MPREIVFGNHSLLVGIDSNYRDFEQGLISLSEFNVHYPNLINQLIDDRIDITDVAHLLEDLKKPHQLKNIVEFTRE